MTELISAVDRARGRLAALSLPLGGNDVERARQQRRAAIDQIDDYLIPRLRGEGAPLLVVVGGSTGAGKSTLVNSLLGAPLTTPGVLRPTTRSPVLVFHPADTPWFAPERILPGLQRVHATAGGGAPTASPQQTISSGDPTQPTRSLRLAAYPKMPPGLALLDAPDIDSVEVANRELAGQLLAAADLWLFVTTAARYADAVPWELLEGAARRHAQVALVIDRIDPGSEAVIDDLRRMMDDHDLGDAPLFWVKESDLDADGLLPEESVAEIAGWLSDLAGDAVARGAVALRTRDGVVTDLAATMRDLAAAADDQDASANRLIALVEQAYADSAVRVRAATSDGAMLRGEVLQRWQDFVGASGIVRMIDRGVSRVRDGLRAFFRGGRASAEPVELAIAHGLQAVVIDAIEAARERVRSGWRADPAGAELVVDGTATAGVTGVTTGELRETVDEQIRGWQGDVLDLVSEQGASRRGLARGLSLGVNGLGVALMLVVFAGTGGLSGVEIGIAGGTAVVAQRLLEAVFGDDAVRRLTTLASERLEERLQHLLEADASIALTAVTALGLPSGVGSELRSAAGELDRADRAERTSRFEVSAGTVEGEGANATRGDLVSQVRLRGAAVRGRNPDSTTEPVAVETPVRERPGFWRRLFGGDQ